MLEIKKDSRLQALAVSGLEFRLFKSSDGKVNGIFFAERNL